MILGWKNVKFLIFERKIIIQEGNIIGTFSCLLKYKGVGMQFNKKDIALKSLSLGVLYHAF